MGLPSPFCSWPAATRMQRKLQPCCVPVHCSHPFVCRDGAEREPDLGFQYTSSIEGTVFWRCAVAAFAVIVSVDAENTTPQKCETSCARMHADANKAL